MKIVTAICTHRRARSLGRMLDSLARAAPPRHAEWQVLIVDNPGSREVQEVAASFRGRLPLEILVEPKTGLAGARNAAIAAARCDYFVWTDDDVTVSETWLRDYEAAFERYPEAAFFGGPIIPRFEGSPPAWINACLPQIYTAFAGRDLSAGPVRFDHKSSKLPFGANMALRAREQYRFRYDLALGRQPGRHIMSGEEVDVLTRICRSGGFGIWVPNAVVEHWIDPERQTIRYLRRYYTGVAFGQWRARLATGAAPWVDDLAARWRLIRSYAAYLQGRMTGKPETWIRALKQSAKLSGQLAAQRELRASARAGRSRG